MIGGALLVVIGWVGTALQKRRAVDDSSSLEQVTATDEQAVREP